MEGFQQKALSGFEWKAADEGAFSATIATFDKVDLDGDVTFAGAFPVGKEIIVGAYNHTSMPVNAGGNGALPTGKGVIRADATRAWIEGKFFIDTPHGRAMYDTVKSLGATADWSYAYPPPMTAPRHGDLMRKYPDATRGIIGVDPVEASAVVKGAGIGTGTDFIKSADLTFDQKAERIFSAFDELNQLKVGRALSSATRSRLAAVMAELTKLLDETEPKTTDNEEQKVDDQSLTRLMRDLERMRSEERIDIRYL